MKVSIYGKIYIKWGDFLKKFRCKICGYEIEAESLPDDFVCPLCGVGKDNFSEE